MRSIELLLNAMEKSSGQARQFISTVEQLHPALNRDKPPVHIAARITNIG